MLKGLFGLFFCAAILSSCGTNNNPSGPQTPSTEAQLSAENEWIAQKKSTGNSQITYQLYDTPIRGTGSQGSYLIYLPTGYDVNTSERYPVIYWLHGGFGSQDEGIIAMENLSKAMNEGKIPPAIIVSPQVLPMGWYVNSIDGKRPLETMVIENLIPHIDATYRTKNDKTYRAVEGMSMGGYGALRFGLKYPEIFGSVSAYAPSILKSMSQEPTFRTLSTFGTDDTVFYQNSPWYFLENNAQNIEKFGSQIRIVTGGNDIRLNETLAEFVSTAKKSNIIIQTQNAANAGHNYKEIIAELGDANFEFWQKAFK